MKKLVALIAVLIFSLVSLTALAEEWFTEDQLSTLLAPVESTIYAATSSAAGQDGVYYCLQNGSLYLWRYEAEAPEKAAQLSPMPETLQEGIAYGKLNDADRAQVAQSITNLAVCGQDLYLVNAYTGTVHRLVNGERELVASFDTAALFDDEWLRMIPQVLTDGQTMLLVEDWQSAPNLPNNYVLQVLDLASGKMKAITLPGLASVAQYQPGQALGIVQNENNESTLYALDLSSGKAEKMALTLPDNALALAYRAEGNVIACATDTGVYASFDGAAFKRVLPHANGYIYPAITGCFLPDGRYAASMNGMTAFDLEKDTGNTLHLSLMYNKNDAVYAAFRSAYPEVQADVQFEHLTAADVASRIASGDTETDIFEIAMDAGFTALVQKGYLQEITDPQIKSDAANLYPAMADALTDDNGCLYAYPSELNISLWTVNRPLWQKYFGDSEPPATYQELFEKMLAFLNADGMENGDLFVDVWDYNAMVRRVIAGYMAQVDEPDTQMTFDEPTLRGALLTLAQVNDALLQRGITAYDEIELYPEVEVSNRSMFYMGGGGSNMLTITYSGDFDDLLPFAFAGRESVIQGYMRVLVVNPLSSHKEEAMAYLALTAQKENGLTLYYKTHPGANDPVEMPDWQTRLAEYREQQADLASKLDAAATAEQKRNIQDKIDKVDWYLNNEDFLRWEMSPESIAAWRAIAPSIRLFEQSAYVRQDDSDITQQVNRVCDAYTDGQLGIDAFLTQLDSITAMIFMEAQ